MNDNFSNPLEAMLASPESGEFTPPDLASRRDSSPYQGKGEPVVTQASPAAHQILAACFLGFKSGLNGDDPRLCPYEKITCEWNDWQKWHRWGTMLVWSE